MSAMFKMLADMLLKEIPPEVRENLTAENLNKVMQAGVDFVREQQAQGILIRQICDKLGIEYDNGNSNGAGDGNGERRRIGSGGS